ncbi:hypothetical protein [Nocardia sp. NPDC052112]|uniref:hypothetical protein n=1 Tax=Nocardia sp. NPDC052112 TaxID=3155646 RepID=UPI0034446351
MVLSRRAALGIAVLGVAAAGVGVSVPAKADERVAGPLATDDQKRIDELAQQLVQTPQVQAEAGRLEQQWSQVMTARLTSLSPQAQAQLGPDIQELVFAYAQKAVNSDPTRPMVGWSGPPHNRGGSNVPGARYAGDVPDQIVRFIPLDNTSTYTLTGRFLPDRPAFTRFQINADTDDIRTLTEFDGRDLVVAPDGTFTITVDPHPSDAANHIQTAAGTDHMLIRDVLGDWSRETPPELVVRRTAGPAAALEKSFDQLVADTVGMLRNQNWIYLYILGIQYPLPPNILPPPIPQMSTNRTFGNYLLNDDQALVVTTQTGGSPYINLGLADTWTVSLPYWQHQTSLNSHQAAANPDGSYTFVISTRDPGVHNWVDTTGLPQGTLLMRWQAMPRGPLPVIPPLTTQVVDLTQLPGVLPAGTPMVTTQRRAAQLDRRRAGYRRNGLGS